MEMERAFIKRMVSFHFWIEARFTNSEKLLTSERKVKTQTAPAI